MRIADVQSMKEKEFGTLVVDLADKFRASIKGDGENIRAVTIISADGKQKQTVELPVAVSTYRLCEHSIELQDGRVKFSVFYPSKREQRETISVAQHILAEVENDDINQIDSLKQIDRNPWLLGGNKGKLLFDTNNLCSLNLPVRVEKIPEKLL